MTTTPYIFPDNFSAEKANNYLMLVQVFADSFSFAVTEQKQLIAFGKNIPLSELAKPEVYRDILTANFQKTVVGLPAVAFTLIPKELFKFNGVLEVARFLDVKSTEAVFSQPLNEDNEIIYKTNGEVLKAVNARLNLQSSVYGQRGWIQFISENYPDNDKVYLNIYQNQVHILYFENRKLRFYNCFETDNKDELVYFIGSAIQELKLSNDQVKLIINGDFEDENDSRIIYLSQFFPQIKINNLSPDLKLPNEIPVHQLLSVTALSLCAS